MRVDLPKRYVLGFLFSPGEKHVLLVEKKKPDWQADLWNGIGGKVEDDESEYEAMYRECREETRLRVKDWVPAGDLSGTAWRVGVWKATLRQGQMKRWRVERETQQALRMFDVDSLPAEVIPNLHWLIPMCLDRHVGAFYVYEKDRLEDEGDEG